METSKFTRKPFDVDAVQVTESNIHDVANWCSGDVVAASGNTEAHIKVRVLRVLNERQTQAFVGDWVLYAGTGYKVYTHKAFKNSFDPVDGVAKDRATQAEKPQTVEELRTVSEPVS